MVQFYALEHGTLGNPYRFVEKDSVVDLTEAEAAIYIKSRWLRPVEEKRKPAPPLMSHMAKTVPQLPEVYRPQPSGDVSTPAYQSNIEAIQRKEAQEDAATNAAAIAAQNLVAAASGAPDADTTTGGDATQGTGNLDVLG